MQENMLVESERETILSWLSKHPSSLSQDSLNERKLIRESSHRIPFGQRAEFCGQDSLNRRLFQIIQEKRSNLCVALDIKTAQEIIWAAEKVAPHVCMIKLHADIITDFSFETLVLPLQKLAKKHNFLILEDRSVYHPCTSC